MTKRPSFNREYIFAELDKLSSKIVAPTRIFIIGGLALINYGLKDATKDIDVVVTSPQDLDVLAKSLRRIGYHELEAPAESGLDWQVIKKECTYQSDSSGRLWEDALLQNLIELREKIWH